VIRARDTIAHALRIGSTRAKVLRVSREQAGIMGPAAECRFIDEVEEPLGHRPQAGELF
jgi:hypothetical protein